MGLCQKAVELGQNGLKRLLVESLAGLVVRIFYCKLDVLQDRVKHLGENFTPKQKLVFVLGSLLEKLKKVVHSFVLLLGRALFDDQIRRVLQEWEPQAFQHSETNLPVPVISGGRDRVPRYFGRLAAVLVGYKPVLWRVQVHTFLVFSVKIVAFLLDEEVNELRVLKSVSASAHELRGL